MAATQPSAASGWAPTSDRSEGYRSAPLITGLSMTPISTPHLVAITRAYRYHIDSAQLADWNAGEALGDDMRSRITASSALAVVTTTGSTLRDYATGGSAAESVWVHTQQLGLAVQPICRLSLSSGMCSSSADLGRDPIGPLHLRSSFQAAGARSFGAFRSASMPFASTGPDTRSPCARR